MTDVKKKTKKVVQDLAGDSFERIKKEPAEMGRSVIEQVSGSRTSQESTNSQEEESQVRIKDEHQSKRLLEANRRELEDIRNNEKIKKALEKIQKGQDINISSIEGLSEEQKEYLRQQKEQVLATLKSQKEEKVDQGLVEPTTKQKRGIFQGVKQKVNQMKTRIETRFKSVG